MKERILTIYLANPRQNAETVLKIYELFAYGDIFYVIITVCKNMLK
jgi:hypothetical protein